MCVTYSPDSQCIATCSLDATVRIWDAKSGRQVGGAMSDHTGHVNSIAYSPDGRSLASTGDDAIVRFWDVENAGTASVQVLAHHEGFLMAVRYSPDGHFIARGGKDQRLEIWDAARLTMKVAYEDHDGLLRSVAWEPSGKRVATGCADRKVRIFDLTKPDIATLLIEGHRGEVNTVSYSPDGSFLASGSDDRSLRLWDSQTGKAAKSPFRGHKDWVTTVAWSPDSTRIISGSTDKTVRVWDVSRGQTLFNGPLYAHLENIWSVSYSPDGKLFVSTDFGHHPRVQVWDATTGKVLLPQLSDEDKSAVNELKEKLDNPEKPLISGVAGKMRAGAAILALVWFPDGGRIASAGEEPLVRVWSVQTGLQVGEISGHHGIVNALSISADGTKLVSASDDQTILLSDTQSMQPLTKPLTKPLTGHDGAVYAVKLSPDGSRVFSGSKDKTVRAWDALTGKVQHVLVAHGDVVRSLDVTKDGSKLASGGDDTSIYVWDTQTYERLAGPFKHDGPVRALSFSPDGSRLISGSDDFTARIWNITTGTSVLDPIRVHTGPIGAVDWSPDGTKLLTAGAHDWTIWLWDASTGEHLLGPLEDHERGIRAAAFSPDGKRIASGSLDHTLRVWDTATGAVSLPVEEEPSVEGTQDNSHVGAETRKRDGVRRQSSMDDSIMNMPATIRKKQPTSKFKGFWDDADLEGPSRRQGKGGRKQKEKNVGKPNHKTNTLGRLWRRRSSRNLKERTTNTDNTEHALARMPRRRATATKVPTARDKLRVLVAGDDPRARLPSQAEPESDEERNSPTGSNRPDDNSSSDDESEHGLVDTICFCLCLPCCK
ncbi:WD40 repeat-like protein [Coniophora puteana RWD-64-598 SS2]|uniref:WD40 repeat-like protein n=1 Tax=Coniophora puteana (strain RWD-64-598) TaxID=741705 RepID=R7SGM7_CONPW|nr:WD40 repeat-like protein [Coniophora puteana RWD-64-598 SS2]EIW74189.1 WD40 repeat-like protein [Coniophora puteana RWD-64-598 SS2]